MDLSRQKTCAVEVRIMWRVREAPMPEAPPIMRMRWGWGGFGGIVVLWRKVRLGKFDELFVCS